MTGVVLVAIIIVVALAVVVVLFQPGAYKGRHRSPERRKFGRQEYESGESE